MSLEIKILGAGCPSCRRLFAEADKAIHQSGVAATLTKVEVIEEIAADKIHATPALVINGSVKSAGRVPDAAEIAEWIEVVAEQRAPR